MFNMLNTICENKKQYCINDMQYFKLALENKLKGDYSLKYKSMLRFVKQSRYSNRFTN